MSSAGEGFVDRPTTLAEYQAIFRRRKWIIIALPLVAAVTAYVLSSRQSPLYQAKAHVRIKTTSIVASIVGASTFSALGDPTQIAATAASVARDQELARQVAKNAGVTGITGDSFLGESSASTQSDAPIIDLSVKNPTAEAATRLTNTYADEFKKYSTHQLTGEIDAAVNGLNKRLHALQSAGATASPQYEQLSTQQSLLIAVGKGLAKNTSAQHALGASQVRPLPKRDAILGALLGLALAIGLAFLAEALDKRVRSEQQIEETLGIPLLGRVPRPTRRLRKAHKLVMLAEPASVHAQTFRRLRTSLEFVNFERGAKTILLTSALPREGKSTTIANLAVALARAGRRVALADLDLRRPFLHIFFNTRSEQGFTDVVVDRVRLDHAMRALALPGTGRPPTPKASGNGHSPGGQNTTNGRVDVGSVLHLLPAGTIPPAADEFLETEGVGTALERLSADFDLVLVDTPPLLAVGDVMTLSAKVDAIVVVARLGIHKRQLEELARQLHTCRAPILGFILTGASHGDSYSYGYGYDARTYEVRESTERLAEEAEHLGGH